jgi:hypothetical protein
MRPLLLAAVPLTLFVVASLTLISGCGQWLCIAVGARVDKGLDETATFEVHPTWKSSSGVEDLRPGA